MRILVTGAAGFVGGNLCHRLSELGLYYHAIDDLSFGDKNNLPNGCLFTPSNFKFWGDGNNLLNQYDILVHLATSNIIYAMGMPIETFVNNSIETIKLFQRFKGKIIYTSTASVYGNAKKFPTKEEDEIQLSNAYDTSKYSAELYLRERGNFTTLRLSNVYGRFQDNRNPYCGVLGKFIDRFNEGKSFPIYGNGIATRDYTYVDDVVDAIVSAINQLPCETEINIATGNETSVLELAEMINEENEIEKLPVRKIDSIQRRCLDISLAKKLLLWEPKTDIATGIKKTIELKKQNA